MSMTRQAGIILPGYDPLNVANAPTIGTATVASGTSVSVAFTAPSCTGGSVITTYTAYCTTTGANTATGASSPITVTGLTTGQTYSFKVIATNIYGPSYPSAASNSATPIAQGQQAYTGVGTSYTWVAPTGVTSVSVVVVGNGSLTGGALSYKNNISVTPGNSYNLAVQTNACNSNPSYFLSTSTVRAGIGSSRLGDGGGNGGTGACGAGGAGGYSGNGGAGSVCGSSGSAGSGGAGGGGATNYGGGGVGLLGQGTSGASSGSVGRGGSGGADASGTSGGLYGGGYTLGTYTSGAVRIIWPGTTRSFPSTNTGDL